MKKRPHYYELVFDVTRSIPRGRVTNYGAIADYLSLGSARMVGWALRQSIPVMDDVPAHRVLNRNGELTGRMHFETPITMQLRLEEEGIVVVNNRVIEFENLFWHPQELDTV